MIYLWYVTLLFLVNGALISFQRWRQRRYGPTALELGQATLTVTRWINHQNRGTRTSYRITSITIHASGASAMVYNDVAGVSRQSGLSTLEIIVPERP